MVDVKPNVQSATLLDNAHKWAAIVTRPDVASSHEVHLLLATRCTRPKFDLPSRHRGIIPETNQQNQLRSWACLDLRNQSMSSTT